MSRRNRKKVQVGGTYRRRGASKAPDPSLSAAHLRKESSPRMDSVSEMLAICPFGWEYDPVRARELGVDEKGYYIHSTSNPVISPDAALEIFINHNYSGQRNFDQAHATALAKDVRLCPDIDIAIGPDGKANIVNGQHSMFAIYLRGRSTQVGLKIYMCRDARAMADLYAIFDNGKIRLLNNAIHAARGAGGISFEGSDARLAKWSMCVAVAHADFSRNGIGRENRSVQLERARDPEVQSFALWMERFVTSPQAIRLTPQGVGAAFFAMWKSDIVKAEKFAEGYFSGANLNPNSPALYIRNKILDRPRGQHAGAVCREHAETIYTAWRKFCLDEPLYAMRRTLSLPRPDKWKIYPSGNDMKHSKVQEVDQ